MVAVMAATIALGLAACGSSDASGNPTLPAGTSAAASQTSEPAIQPASTEPAATEPTATPVGTATVVLSEADVADLEKQLDEIDQLLAGVDADLNQD